MGEQVESLFDEALPVAVRELPEQLARLDELLSDPALLAPIAERWEAAARDRGRPTIAMPDAPAGDGHTRARLLARIQVVSLTKGVYERRDESILLAVAERHRADNRNDLLRRPPERTGSDARSWRDFLLQDPAEVVRST